MNQKKNLKIIIILIIITLIILLVGGIILAYLSTDLFKSNKDLFFQYTAQIVDSENGMMENSLKQYLEKKKTTPYTNEGTFSVNITSENGQGQFEKLEDFAITFSGQVDTANSKVAQEISLNYSDTVNFPISYKQIGNTIGLQTKYVGSKYIAVETDNLNNLSGDIATSIEETTSGIEKMRETTQVQLTEEEINQIQNTYIAILNQKLGNEKFSKIKEANRNGYKLSLTGEELKGILVQLLETLENDQTTLEKLNQYLKIQKNSAKITVSDLEEQINYINNNSDFDEEKIEITVYEKSRKVTGIFIATNEMNITLEKETNTDELKYNGKLEIIGEDETNQIKFAVKYTGISTMQKVGESYSFDYQTPEIEGQYTLENNIDLTISNSIEEFTDENAMILTDYEPEQVENFLQAVMERITQVNQQQMEELGLEENENPLITGIISPIMQMNINRLGFSAGNATQLSETEIASFNEKFEMYASTNLQGVTVKGLLSTISLNNELQDNERQIREINFNGEEYEASEQNIAFIKEDIDTQKGYRVEFEKDQDTGMIYRVVINEK